MSGSVALLLLLIIIIFNLTIIDVSFCNGRPRDVVCRHDEKEALFGFKKELKDPSNRLSSWVDGVDCCSKWVGVVCHNITGHVLELRLANPGHDRLPLGGKLSPSLLQLKQLRHLDLSLNYFGGAPFPNFFGFLENLQFLNLSHAGFQGDGLHSLLHINFSFLVVLDLSHNKFTSVIPPWIFSLSALVYLDLSHNGFVAPFPDAPWNFASLNILDISYNNLSGTLPRQLLGLSDLVSLSLNSNKFTGPLPNSSGKMTKLRYVDLSYNSFNSTIPNWIYDCTGLEWLDLSSNQFQGTISDSISNWGSLSVLDMSNNMLTGEIPKHIGELCKLKRLALFENKFWGLTSQLFKSMSGCLSDSVQDLWMSSNDFSGSFPETLSKFSSLESLVIHSIHLSGGFPENLGLAFPMLQRLSIENNMLEGMVTENHFATLTKLTALFAYGNGLTLNVSRNWIPPFQLVVLDLSGWKLGPQFPSWLQSQRQISHLDISSAGIEGNVPTWFWNLSSQIQFLNLSHNQLRGEIHNISTVRTYLSSNQFSGPLPYISSSVEELDLSNNFFRGDVSGFLCNSQNKPHMLEMLNLGGNGLSGEIPDCWMQWPHLRVINMGDNSLIGMIPNSMGFLVELMSLDLHMNTLSGHLPSSFQNCTNLLKLDLAENELAGEIPEWLGSRLSSLIILRLRSNKFHGELPPEFCHLTSLRILDLARNNFFGPIPRCLKNLTAMVKEELVQLEGAKYYPPVFGETATVVTKGQEYQYGPILLLLLASMDVSSNNFSGNIPTELTALVGLRSLNLSRNNLTGNIPEEMGSMKLLESIDLSRNYLSGEIPYSLSNLYALGYLNLSYNNLSGKIPTGTQLQSFSASCYIGNNLCGPPLPECSNDDDIPNLEDTGDDSEAKWFYISMAIGFVVGLWGFWGSLFVIESWRRVYFQFLDDRLKSLLRWFGL